MTERATWPIRIVSAANLREHHHAKARRVKRERSTALMMARTTLTRPALPCIVELIRIAPRPLDDDNAVSGMKAVRDAIAEWLDVDDRDPRVVWIYEQERGKPRQYALRVEVTPTVAKLSGHCIVCKTAHSMVWMNEYLAQCEARGKNPLASTTGGILCAPCLWASILDIDVAEDAREEAARVAEFDEALG